MKKLAIAGASAVLAALPVVGAFAAATSTSFTDTLNVTVDGGCTIESNATPTAGDYSASDRTFTNEHVTAGTVVYLNATSATDTAPATAATYSISCNSASASKKWTINVAVDGLTHTDTTTTIPGAAVTSGNASGWAIKSNATAGTGVTDNFASYTAAANGVFMTATADKSATFNPSYQVYVKPDQKPGAYTGTATYTIEFGDA